MKRTTPSPLRDVLARNLRRLRAERGWSQERLAHEAGLNRTYLSAVERSEQNISVDNVHKLSLALATPAGVLLIDAGTTSGWEVAPQAGATAGAGASSEAKARSQAEGPPEAERAARTRADDGQPAPKPTPRDRTRSTRAADAAEVAPSPAATQAAASAAVPDGEAPQPGPPRARPKANTSG